MKKTIVIVSAIIIEIFIFNLVIWPIIQDKIVHQACNVYGKDYVALRNHYGHDLIWSCCNYKDVDHPCISVE